MYNIISEFVYTELYGKSCSRKGNLLDMQEALESCTSDSKCTGVMNKCKGLSGVGNKCMKFEPNFHNSGRYCVHRKGINILQWFIKKRHLMRLPYSNKLYKHQHLFQTKKIR